MFFISVFFFLQFAFSFFRFYFVCLCVCFFCVRIEVVGFSPLHRVLITFALISVALPYCQYITNISIQKRNRRTCFPTFSCSVFFTPYETRLNVRSSRSRFVFQCMLFSRVLFLNVNHLLLMFTQSSGDSFPLLPPSYVCSLFGSPSCKATK